jgi:ABC-type multidrug transport system fused ATPase/permease subunit
MRNMLSSLVLWFTFMLIVGMLVLMVIYKLAWLITLLAVMFTMCCLIALPFYLASRYKYNQYLKRTKELYEEERREKAFAEMFRSPS